MNLIYSVLGQLYMCVWPSIPLFTH